MAGLGNRFHVPAWVGHEVFGKISAKPELFIPMANAAEQAIQAVETLQVEARRYVDDGRAKATDEQSDRLSYLGNLDSLARHLLRPEGLFRPARQTGHGCRDWNCGGGNKTV